MKKTSKPKATTADLYVILTSGMRYHHQGDLKRAKDAYRRVLNAQPKHADALHLLGVIALQTSTPDKALKYIDKAISVNAKIAEYQLNKGLALKALGRLREAEKSIKKAIKLKPELSVAYFNLSSIQLMSRKWCDAKQNLQKTLELEPDHIEACNSLGILLKNQGQLEEAEAIFLKTLSIKSQYPEALNNLANVYHLLGKFDQAIDCYDKVLNLKPDDVATLSNLANVFLELGYFDRALANYQKVIQAYPQSAEAYYNMGNALTAKGQLDLAISNYHKALTFNADYAEIHNNLGSALVLQGNLVAAAASFKRALEVNNSYSEALDNLIDVQLKVCDWSGLAGLRQRLLEPVLDNGENIANPPRPFLVTRLPLPVTDAERQTIARVMTHKKVQRFSQYQQTFDLQQRRRDKKCLRIAYISTDFNDHATSHLIHDLFALHNRAQFDVFAYSIGKDDESDYRQKIVQSCDVFTDVKNEHAVDIAKRIYHDEIDLLVDLNGHTASNRIEIFSLRPAPVQITYLGFPSTTGADFFDYVITDKIVTPAEKQVFFDETFVYMPHSYQVNSERKVASEIPSRKECGLPEQGFVFCCFNNHYKIEPMIFEIWARILSRVPDSVLWLLGGPSALTDNLRKQAQKYDFAPERLVFAQRVPIPQHLARHFNADLFLDTYYYNAHTTASDALWCGLPVITCPGDSFASRVGQSLVTAAGIPELAVTDFAAYEDTAVRLACNPDELRTLKQRLLKQRPSSPLFDTARFVSNLEQGYLEMWRRYKNEDETDQMITIVDDRDVVGDA